MNEPGRRGSSWRAWLRVSLFLLPAPLVPMSPGTTRQDGTVPCLTAAEESQPAQPSSASKLKTSSLQGTDTRVSLLRRLFAPMPHRQAALSNPRGLPPLPPYEHLHPACRPKAHVQVPKIDGSMRHTSNGNAEECIRTSSCHPAGLACTTVHISFVFILWKDVTTALRPVVVLSLSTPQHGIAGALFSNCRSYCIVTNCFIILIVLTASVPSLSVWCYNRQRLELRRRPTISISVARWGRFHHPADRNQQSPPCSSMSISGPNLV